ncbi:MAG TPA: FAD-dependent oxidoreductase [Thermoanaerobaculia bacterium]|nr:FAD-dependent oxidoreductase [Thermoanaerobaculia bacterium]
MSTAGAPGRQVDVAIVGSGFAGSILARALRASGLEVALLERGRHPRFALGESTTPLANLALERLAMRYELPDLWELAAHGRWLESFPGLRRGLKRGFTFYRQPTGRRHRGSRSERLLVAASPNDEVADTHWLRADVDAHLVKRAQTEGVLYRDGVEVELFELDEGGGEIAVSSGGVGGRSTEDLRLRCRFLVDASGAGGFLARALELPPHPAPMRFASRLVFAHFEGVPRFAEVEPEAESGDPYPADRAAVHHLLDVGWMYQLRFDDESISAGLLVDPQRTAALGLELEWDDPGSVWSSLVSRHPSLERQLREARPLREIAASPGAIQRRLARAAGARWAMLPQAYASFDALFSTGIAWSLVAVERLAASLGTMARSCSSAGELPGVREYERRLSLEADQLERLLTLGYRHLDDFERFVESSLLYFALTSFAETRQRLLEPGAEPSCRVEGLDPAWAWDGFLSALDPVGVELLERACRLSSGPSALDADSYRSCIRSAIAPRNVAGLGDPERHPLYPVDPEAIIAAAGRLGIERAEARRLLPRLLSPRRFPALIRQP